jgi:hypothetical protein
VQVILDAYTGSRARILDRLPSLNGDRELLNAAVADGTVLSLYETTYGKDAGYAQFQDDVLVFRTIAAHMDDRSGMGHWLASR